MLSKAFLSTPSSWQQHLHDLPFNVISEEQAAKLEGMFTEEILVAILGLNGDKALGSSGFPLTFWSSSWDFVKDEVMSFFREFYEHNIFVKSLKMLHS